MKQNFDENIIRKQLVIDAKGLDIPSGAAELFINKVLQAVKAAIQSKTTLTNHDLKRIITKELQKYNSDFAYIYKNRDKII